MIMVTLFSVAYCHKESKAVSLDTLGTLDSSPVVLVRWWTYTGTVIGWIWEDIPSLADGSDWWTFLLHFWMSTIFQRKEQKVVNVCSWSTNSDFIGFLLNGVNVPSGVLSHYQFLVEWAIPLELKNVDSQFRSGPSRYDLVDSKHLENWDSSLWDHYYCSSTITNSRIT